MAAAADAMWPRRATARAARHRPNVHSWSSFASRPFVIREDLVVLFEILDPFLLFPPFNKVRLLTLASWELTVAAPRLEVLRK